MGFAGISYLKFAPKTARPEFQNRFYQRTESELAVSLSTLSSYQQIIIREILPSLIGSTISRMV